MMMLEGGEAAAPSRTRAAPSGLGVLARAGNTERHCTGRSEEASRNHEYEPSSYG